MASLTTARSRAFHSFYTCLCLWLAFFLPVSLQAGAAGDLGELAVGSGDLYIRIPAPSVYPASSADSLKAYFIDVGQGDAGYIELPNGKNVLIDGGPGDPFGSGPPPLARFLSSHNVTKIDYMVLTHPHADHYTGLLYVAENMKVENFYDTRADNTRTMTDDVLRERIRDSGANVFYPSAGDSLNWDTGSVGVKVLNSCSSPVQTSVGGELNNCSIVLKVTYQDTSILYTGDLEAEGEAEMVKRFGSELESDILKVGHHGSQNSTGKTLLSFVKPRDAVISVGSDNTYGHPTPGCLSRLADAGAVVHRTDIEGTVSGALGRNSHFFGSDRPSDDPPASP